MEPDLRRSIRISTAHRGSKPSRAISTNKSGPLRQSVVPHPNTTTSSTPMPNSSRIAAFAAAFGSCSSAHGSMKPYTTSGRSLGTPWVVARFSATLVLPPRKKSLCFSVAAMISPGAQRSMDFWSSCECVTIFAPSGRNCASSGPFTTVLE